MLSTYKETLKTAHFKYNTIAFSKKKKKYNTIENTY